MRADRDALLEELGAAHTGHSLIGDDQGRVLLLKDFQPLSPVRSRQDTVVRLEGVLEKLEDRDLVVDDENRVLVISPDWI
jgi:hypothetical protein